MNKLTEKVREKIRRIEVVSTKLADDVFAGAWHSAFKGRGIEFEEVRPFFEGDDIRDIDWNVTARTNIPHVKRFREERELSVMLIVDVSRSTHYGSQGLLKSEFMAEISAVLAFSAIKNNDRIGLILFSDRVEKYIPPKKGIRHVLHIVRELLLFEPQGVKTDIKPALHYFGNIQPKRSICFLIHDLMCELPKKPLSVLAHKHDLISLQITDPYETTFPKIGMATIKDLETGLAKLINTNIQDDYDRKMKHQLDQNKEMIQQIGGTFLNIETGSSYLKELKRFFAKRKGRLT